MSRRVAVAGLAVVVILAGAGCRPSGNNGGAAGSEGAGITAPQVIDLGTAILVDGVQITVQDAKSARGFEFQAPASGYVFVAYEIRARAVDGDHLISSSAFTASADGSQQGRSTIVIADQWEPLLSFEDLKEGKTISGWIVFEVPEPGEYVELAYDARLFSGQPTFLLRTPCCD